MTLSEKDIGKTFWVEVKYQDFKYIGPGKFVEFVYDNDVFDDKFKFDYWFVILTDGRKYCFREDEIKYPC